MNPVLLLRSQNPYAVLSLMIFTLVAKATSLAHPEIPEPGSSSFLFDWIQSGIRWVFGDLAFLYSLLAVALLFAQSLHLTRIVRSYQLFANMGYLPSFLYIVWTSVHPGLSQWGMPILLAGVFLYGLEALLSLHQSLRPRLDLFHAGFALGLAAALYFPAIILLLGLVMGLVQLRSFQMREWLVALMGLVTPFYFLGAISFLFDKGHLWPSWFQADFPMEWGWSNVYVLFLGLVSVLLGFASLYMAHRFMPKTNVFTSRTWVILLLYLPMTAMAALLDPYENLSVTLLMAAPASLLCLHLFHAEIRKGFRNFVFYFFIFFMAMGQVIWHYP